MNHDGYTDRLQFLKGWLKNEFNFEVQDVEPIAYDKDCPFPYNNFIYHVKINRSEAQHQCPVSQPGTQSIPHGTTSFVARLAHVAAETGLHHVNRVENEVAAMTLAREALKHISGGLVPEIYGWCSAANGQGWMLQEFRPGVDADSVFPDLSLEQQKLVLSQIAGVVAALQSFRVPDSVGDYGGLSFDRNGSIVTGPMTTHAGSFADDYTGLYRAMFDAQLREADGVAIVDGWVPNGVRQRIERFLNESLGKIISRSGLDTRAVLVHGDLTTNNVLVDKETLSLTAVLDFDFAHIGTAADEFLWSFGNIGGTVPGPCSNDADTDMLRSAMLNGFSDAKDPAPQDSEVFIAAKLWDEALKGKRAARPSTVKGIDSMSAIHELMGSLCPFRLCHPVVAARQSAEQKKQYREEAEAAIWRSLDWLSEQATE